MKIVNFIKSIVATIAAALILTNSNAQWVKLSQFPALKSNSRIQFIDSNIGWMSYSHCDNCNVFQTINGGKNWKEVAPFGNAFGSKCSFLYFKNREEGIVSWGRKEDYRYVNRKTIDGGQSWQNITMDNHIDKDQPKILSLQFVQDVYLGIVYQDNVVSMAKIKNDSMQILNKINEAPNSTFFCDTLIGYSTVAFGLRKTVNGGKTWIALRTGISFGITKLFFTDKDHGLAIAANIILYTNNGGLNWKDVSLPNNKLFFNDVTFTTTKIGYICGSQGMILKTTDGGLSWKEMDSGTFEGLNSLSFPDSTIGYCVGDNGIVIKLIEDLTVPQVTKILVPSNTLCAGIKYNISYTVNKKFNNTNLFTAYLSNALGEFSLRGIVGTLNSDTSGIISITIPPNTRRNLGYRIRIQSSSPEGMSATNDSYIEIQPSIIPSIAIATAQTDVCDGAEISLTTKITNGGALPKISWYSGNQLVSNSPTIKVTPKDKAEYWARVKSNAVCATPDSATSNTIVFKIVTPTKPTISVIGNTLTSSATMGNQWYKGLEIIPLATAPTYTAGESGIYKVAVNDGSCPTQFSDAVSVNIAGSETVSELSRAIRLYPNPASTTLGIQTNLQIVKLIVYQSNGIKILESSTTENLDVAVLPQGLYLLEVYDIEGNRVLKKFEKR